MAALSPNRILFGRRSVNDASEQEDDDDCKLPPLSAGSLYDRRYAIGMRRFPTVGAGFAGKQRNARSFR
jgi:hypothetical protein